MAQRGGKREGAGRKPLDIELKARDMIMPHVPKAVEVLVKIMENELAKEADRISATRLLLSYYWGQPKQYIDATTNGKDLQQPVIQVYTNPDASELNRV